MRVELCLEPGSLRAWHADLISALGRRPGVVVSVRWLEDVEPLPSCVAVLFALERVLHGWPDGCSQVIGPADLPAHDGGGAERPDVAIDLSGRAETGDIPTWTVTFDGATGMAPLVAALLAGRTPLVAVADISRGKIASGRPGVERPHVIVGAFEEVLARTTTLILAAISGAGTQLVQPAPSADLACTAVGHFATKALARAALHRLYRLLYRTPHWRTGWRFVDGPDVVDLGRHPEGGWHDLPDDGLRFYADPFPVIVEGQTWIFVEDLEHRTGKGVISAVAFDDEGPVGTPRPVLERPVHLSYPFVFQEAGQVWMIPESLGAGTIDLFRATRFPDGWVHEATLVDDVEASDATPFRHAGRWWMTATVRDGASYSDALHVWSAATLHGPWTPHARNPVLVDLASARPAGRVVSRGGRLIRPVQDCRGGYGAGLALAEITRLDDHAFEQTVGARLGPGPLWPGRRLHTLNRAGRLECIDGSALAPRWRRHSRAA